jgi:thiol-disulfide isomerase/thioredoxin
MPARFLAPAASAVLVLFAIAGCSERPGRADRAARAAAPGDTAVVPATAAQLRARASAPGAAATVLNVWATWCVPCREEFPALVAAARRHPEVRLVLVSADFDDQLPAVRAFLGGHGVTDTTWLKSGSDQEFIDGIDSTWSGALPATVVYDARGRTVAFWEGAADSARFEAAISKALHNDPEGVSR